MRTDTLFKIGGCAGSFPAPSENRAVFDPDAPWQIRRQPFRRELYGSRTTSFLLRHRDTIVIIDHGLGVEPIAAFLLASLKHEGAGQSVVHCIQTHYHEDHLSGLRASSLMFQKNMTLRFYSPDLSAFLTGNDNPPPGTPVMEEVLRNTFRECYWPVTLEKLKATGAAHEHVAFKPGEILKIGQLRVRTMPLTHPGGCCGLRFEIPGVRDIVIATDYEPADNPSKDVVEFFQAAGLLIADMQYRDCEYEGECAADGVAFPRVGWGHGSPRLTLPAILKCKERPQRVRISHHDPKRSDMDLRMYYEETITQLEQWKSTGAFEYEFAHDGDVFWF